MQNPEIRFPCYLPTPGKESLRSKQPKHKKALRRDVSRVEGNGMGPTMAGVRQANCKLATTYYDLVVATIED